MKMTEKEDPCWFGFPAVVRENAPFSRNQLTEYLEKNKIGTRNVFSGNLLKHPAYLDLGCRIIRSLKNADLIMNSAFWIGVFPGINKARLDYMKKKIKEFIERVGKTKN